MGIFKHEDLGFSIYPVLIEEEEKCKGSHKVDGIRPQLADVHLDKRTCDCGRLKYIAEECGCHAGQKHLELKEYPNE